MKKIAIFTGYYLPHVGGVERYTYQIAREFAKNGHKVYVITSRYDETLPEIEETECAVIYRLPTRRIFVNQHPILKFNHRQKELMNILEKENIDFCIFQTRFWLTTMQGAKFSKKNHIKSILIEHGTSHFTSNNKIRQTLGASYEHFLTRIIKNFDIEFYGVSKECVKWLKHFSIEGKGVLYNSIDVQEYEEFKNKRYDFPIEKDKVRIGFIGRVIRNKGINELVEAYNKLKEKYNITLIIVGDGPLKEKIQKENPDIIFMRKFKT